MPEELKKVTVSDESDFMQEARDRWKEGEAGMEDIIKNSLDDIAMVDGENQWEKKVKQEREDLGLVCLTENVLPSFLDQVEGDFRQNKPQIDVVAVDDKSDPKTARIMAGMIRAIDNNSQAEMIYNEAFFSMLASSFGAWRIHTEYEDPMSFNKVIVTQPIENPHSLRWDMTCKKFDTSDKKWAHISDIVTQKEYEARWGKSHPISTKTPAGDEYKGWYIDKAYRVSEYWYIKETDTPIALLSTGDVVKKSDAEGIIRRLKKDLPGIKVVDERVTQIPTVCSSIISGEEILEGPFEWPGKYIPIPICFGKKLNLNGKTRLKSLIRDAKESQRMHNYLISSMVQAVAIQQKAPYIGTTTQLKNKKEEWKSGMQGIVPFVTYDHDANAPGPPHRDLPPQASSGFAELLMQNATTRMDIVGIHQAGLGMVSNEKSGIAIKARQHEGDVGTFVFIDNFRHALTFDGRIKVDLIPKIYDTPRMQRILGIDGKEDFVNLYEPDPLHAGKIKANLKVGKYDVVVTTGPSFTTQREETKEAMVQIIQASGPQSPATQIMLPGVIRAMDWQDSDKIANALISMLPQQVQQILNDKGDGEAMDPKVMAVQQAMNQQVQQMQQQMQQAMQQAQEEIQKLQQENQQLKAGTEAKMAQIEADKALSAQELQFKKEQLMAEMTMHEQELKQKTDLALNEMKAKMALELTMFNEKMKVETSLKEKEIKANKAVKKKAAKAE